MPKNHALSGEPDRLGRFLGQLRIHEGITLEQLAQGLCTLSYLNKIENGEREVGKQLTDTFFQRLGKPAELFDRILDQEEFQQWTQRQKIIVSLNHGDIAQAKERAKAYEQTSSGVLDRQFLKIVDINCAYLADAEDTVLFPMVCDALLLTQPRFQTAPVNALLLSQNEGRLLFAYLRLKEQKDGFHTVAESYYALLRYFKSPRYERRERVYLLPYVALRVIAHEYHNSNFSFALSVCEDALQELTTEHLLYGYDSLLEWKQRLYDALGNRDRTPEKLLWHLRAIQEEYGTPKTKLLIPCEERGNVYCLNQVIRERRQLLGLSQETLADGICAPRTISRIENDEGKVQKKNRRALLQKLHLSGERYDYEVITDRYEDYLLRSDLGRAVTAKDWTQVKTLLDELQSHTPNTPNNQQYILSTVAKMREALPPNHPDKITLAERRALLQQVLSLTLPLNIDEIDTWRECKLSLNEFLTLMTIAVCYKKENNHEKSLPILSYIIRCLKNSETDILCYADLYARAEINMALLLNDLGKYQEALTALKECIKLSLHHRNFKLLSLNLYAISGNIEALSKESTPKKAIGLLRHAYAASILLKDIVGQRFLAEYTLETYGIVLTL